MYARGGDNDLLVCADMDNDTQDAAFLSNLVEDGEKDQDGKDVDNHEDKIYNHPPPPKIKVITKPSNHWRIYDGFSREEGMEAMGIVSIR